MARMMSRYNDADIYLGDSDNEETAETAEMHEFQN